MKKFSVFSFQFSVEGLYRSCRPELAVVGLLKTEN